MHSEVEPYRLAGKYVINDLEQGGFYWHAYLGEERINGGLCETYTECVHTAKRAIMKARQHILHEEFYWDVETREWVRKGELPTVS